MNSSSQELLTLQQGHPSVDARYSLGNRILDALWDTWCIVSVVGWWPRFIEPNWIKTVQHTLPIENLSTELEGLRILHFSDLHFSERTSTRFLRRILKNIDTLAPDLILFSGDFMCYATPHDMDRLQAFFSVLEAPYGVFATYGNHDYSSYVSRLPNGETVLGKIPKPLLAMMASRLLAWKKHGGSKGSIPEEGLKPHPELEQLLRHTNVQLLDNETVFVPIGGSGLNVCGVGDLWAGSCKPEEAFKGYQEQFPGVVLAHNPDSIRLMQGCPGELILSGHTHGGQVNLPLVRRFLASPMEFPQLKRGMQQLFGKKIYITQGVGSHIPFRWFARPDISVITLKGKR